MFKLTPEQEYTDAADGLISSVAVDCLADLECSINETIYIVATIAHSVYLTDSNDSVGIAKHAVRFALRYISDDPDLEFFV